MDIKPPTYHDNMQRKQSDLLKDSGYDAFEKDTLVIARLFLMTFTKPQSHDWISAFEGATARFGPPFGATIAMAVSNVIRALGQSRTTPFQFINPHCPCCRNKICDEERYLLSALQATRRNRRSEARTFAMLVCEGNDAEKLIVALEQLSLILGEGPLVH